MRARQMPIVMKNAIMAGGNDIQKKQRHPLLQLVLGLQSALCLQRLERRKIHAPDTREKHPKKTQAKARLWLPGTLSSSYSH